MVGCCPKALTVALALLASPWSHAATSGGYFVPPAANGAQQGFIRIINGEQAGTVTVWGIDPEGQRSPGFITFAVGPFESRQFNSQDLEQGNPEKGISGGIGTGGEPWTLVVSSDLDMATLAYIRTADGFLTSVGDVAPGGNGHVHVPIFNPADNLAQYSLLRLTNIQSVPVDVTVRGVDDAGQQGQDNVRVTIPPLASIRLSGKDLEEGNAYHGLTGILGNGTGKWQLSVSSTADIRVESLLFDPQGYVTNLSTVPDTSSTPADPQVRSLWMVPPASNTKQQGFVRVINRSAQSGNVTVTAVDSAGQPAVGTLSFSLGPHESKQFNSQDLEYGNPAKQLSGAIGQGTGNWSLSIRSVLDIEALAYIRTPKGFLTAIHDTLPSDDDGVYIAPMFNPARNKNQESRLRIVNPQSQPVEVAITAQDDNGDMAAGGIVGLTLPARAAVELTAEDIENGNAAKRLRGSLGAGVGKWLLAIATTAPVKVMSLVEDPNGYLVNVSTLPEPSSMPFGSDGGGGGAAAPFVCTFAPPVHPAIAVEPGYAKGHIVDTQGNPMPGVKVTIDNTILYNASVTGTTDAQGNYRIHVGDGSWRAYAEFNRPYDGKTFKVNLHPEVADSFAGVNGGVRNFSWRLCGEQPPPQVGVYGGLVNIFNDPNGPTIIDLDNIVFTFTPAGPLIDGTTRSSFTARSGAPMTDTYGKIDDLPIGRYTISAEYAPPDKTPTPMKIRIDGVGAYGDSVTTGFNPQMNFCNNCVSVQVTM